LIYKILYIYIDPDWGGGEGQIRPGKHFEKIFNGARILGQFY
jgi:hypothetical protein